MSHQRIISVLYYIHIIFILWQYDHNIIFYFVLQAHSSAQFQCYITFAQPWRTVAPARQAALWSIQPPMRGFGKRSTRVSCERGMPEATWLLLITQQYPISSDIGDLTSGYLMISYDIYPKGLCKSFPEAMDAKTFVALRLSMHWFAAYPG